MKHTLIKITISGILIFTLSGCAKQKTSIEKMTQSIMVETSTSLEETSASLEETNFVTTDVPSTAQTETPMIPNPTETLSFDSTLQQYSQIKAQLDALEIDLENLESQFRIQAISQTTLQEQKNQLIQQKQVLDVQEVKLEFELNQTMVPNSQYQTTDVGQLLTIVNQLEQKENSNDLQQEQLKFQYRTAAISKDVFIAEQTKQLMEEEQIDFDLDYIERQLEKLGYDD